MWVIIIQSNARDNNAFIKWSIPAKRMDLQFDNWNRPGKYKTLCSMQSVEVKS